MYHQLNNIGTTIKTIREAKNIKQYILQNALTNPCNLSKIEANKSQVSLIIFYEILSLLDISTDEFFMLHEMHETTARQQYDAVNDHFTYNASRIARHDIVKALVDLSIYEHESLQNVKAMKPKLLYHKLSCFYYLNFEHDRKKAQEHSSILLDYYKNSINHPLLSDFNLLPMILPFVSIQEAQVLLADFELFPHVQIEQHYFVYHVYMHVQLTFAKRCLQERQYRLLRKTLATLDLFIPHFPIIDVYSELFILKGIYFCECKSEPSLGKPLIHQGLKLANDFHLSNIYAGWQHYTQRYDNKE